MRPSSAVDQSGIRSAVTQRKRAFLMHQPQLGRFGDRRLAATGDALLAAMQTQRSMCLRSLACDRDETRRFNDFLDNEAVTRHEMLTHAARLTAGRATARHV